MATNGWIKKGVKNETKCIKMEASEEKKRKEKDSERKNRFKEKWQKIQILNKMTE